MATTHGWLAEWGCLAPEGPVACFIHIYIYVCMYIYLYVYITCYICIYGAKLFIAADINTNNKPFVESHHGSDRRLFRKSSRHRINYQNYDSFTFSISTM